MSLFPSISVVIPVFNRADTVSASIESVLAQTLSPMEVILVDDGSEDGSPEILKQYSDQYPCIRVVTLANGGPARARNQGVTHAGGEWIAFLDSDDYWYPFHLENLAKVAMGHPKLHWVSSAFERETNGAVFPERLHYTGKPEVLESYLSAVLHGHPINTNTVLLCRRIFLELNGFREDWTLGEDSNLWYRWGILHPELGYSYTVSSRYCQTASSLTQQNKEMASKVEGATERLAVAVQYAHDADVMDRLDVQAFLGNWLNNILKTCCVVNLGQFRALLGEYADTLPGFSLSWKTRAYFLLSRIPGCSPRKIAHRLKRLIRR